MRRLAPVALVLTLAVLAGTARAGTFAVVPSAPFALPGLALANQLYLALKAQGYGRKGTQALMLALEHVSNVKR